MSKNIKKKKAKYRLKKKYRLVFTMAVLVLLAIGALILVSSPAFIILNGDDEVNVAYQKEYEDPGAEVLLKLGIVRIENNVNTQQLGDYEVIYRFMKAKRVRIVHVIDKNKPDLTLKGSASMTIAINQKYNEPGYEAIDNVDGDVSANVKINGNVDTSKAGEYILDYEVKDKAGNTAHAKRQINVVANGPLVDSIKDFSLKGYFTDVILPYTSEDTSAKQKDLVYFGDSIIGNLVFDGKLKTGHLWTRSSMTPENVYTREINVNYKNGGTFFNALNNNKPETVLMLIGTNAMSSTTVDFFVSQYDDLLKKLKAEYPDTKFIVVSILPVDYYYDEKDNQLRNDKINKINYHLCELCQIYGYPFMNVAECLKDSEGRLKAEYAKDDHIHPNALGSKAIIEYINTHLSY